VHPLIYSVASVFVGQWKFEFLLPAKEGGRQFAEGSLRTVCLPWPLPWWWPFENPPVSWDHGYSFIWGTIRQWQKWQYNTIQYNKRIQKATIRLKTLKSKTVQYYMNFYSKYLFIWPAVSVNVDLFVWRGISVYLGQVQPNSTVAYVAGWPWRPASFLYC